MSPAEYMTRMGYHKIPLVRLGDRPQDKRTGARNWLLAEVKWRGRKRRWVVDTGANLTAVNRRWWRNAEREAKGARSIRDSGMAFLGATADFELGGWAFPAEPVAVGDLDLAGGRVDGLLGLDFLARHHAVVDEGANLLYLRSAPSPSEVSEDVAAAFRRSGWTEIPLATLPRIQLLSVSAHAGGSEFGMLVDSGAVFAMLDRRLAEAAGIRAHRTGLKITGVQGRPSELEYGTVASIRIGDLWITNQTIGIASLPQLAAHGRARAERTDVPFEGVLGADWLTRGAGVIDVERRRLFLRPLPSRP